MEMKTKTSIKSAFFWLIELLVYWEGQVTPSNLAKIAGISRQQASKNLSQYRLKNPESLCFCKRKKAYLPTDFFYPYLINQDIGEYLHWITNQKEGDSVIPANKCLLPPMREIKPGLMRPLMQAMREQKRVEVNYVSINNPDHEGRIIVPHHLINTGLRWHLRAWCEKNQEFRDFVLGRFQGDADLLDKSNISSAEDSDWHTQVTIVIAPDPRLSAEQRRVIEFEYAMENGQLEIVTRACLVSYKLQLLNINPRIYEADAKAQQLVIVNKDDIHKWLFD